MVDATQGEPSRVVNLLANETLGVGRHEIRKGVVLDVIEAAGEKKHRHFRGSWPESNGIEEGFGTGPVLCLYAEDSIVDLDAGLTLLDGRPVRETAVVAKLTDGYQVPSASDLAAARVADPSQITLPIGSQRMRNYCRWWLDSIAKLYICGISPVARSESRGAAVEALLPELEYPFHRQTSKLYHFRKAMSQGRGGLVRGRSVNSPGLTFGGGQRIGATVCGFSQYLDLTIPPGELETKPGPLLYTSRNESGMRRIVNEEELLPGLRDIGFNVITPGDMPLRDQIEHFRAAKVVLSPHGAGLTNIVFCRPGTTLIEIFPDGGVHGSAFLRIASHLDFNYYFFVGAKIETRQGRSNPNNSDLSIEKEPFLAFVRAAVDAAL